MACAYSDAEVGCPSTPGADKVVAGEREIAREMTTIFLRGKLSARQGSKTDQARRVKPCFAGRAQ